ncbi:signal transduction histidine kinase [Leptolyngbyaceae cyanobacterium JSC-12]|nr:signal transduction histidine kinase [Leptolyngbyaceae cyanobacterium JSC-12]
MSLTDICLEEFVQPLPACSGAASLKAILETMSQSGGDRLVITDAWQQPLGLVQLHRLLPYLLAALSLPSDAAKATLPDIPAVLACPLQNLSASIIEPLTALPAAWTLQQFLPHLSAQPDTHYALVNQAGELLGLLERERLLQALAESLAAVLDNQSLVHPPLAHQARESVGKTSIDSSEVESFQVESSAERLKPLVTPQYHVQQQQILKLTQQLLAQRADLEQRIKTQQEEILHLRLRHRMPQVPLSTVLYTANLSTDPSRQQTLLDSLLQLLERLPIPLMLQTSSGQVVAQNRVWREQVGELSDPVKIWQEAAVWLSGQAPSEPTQDTRTPWLPDDASLRSPTADRLSSSAESICQLGTNPDTCVCVCPLKDGREQVLQFVKVSLGSLLPDLKLDWSKPTPAPAKHSHATESTPAQPHPFTLATLVSTSEAVPLPFPNHDTLTVPDFPSIRANSELSQAANESLWLILAQDVTKQQHLARELTAKNADLVQLNRLKDEFLACISHELKTPLTAVLGLSSLLKDQTLGELNQRQVHYAQLIYQSSRHLMGVVNDILDLTRIETGQLELIYSPVDIAIACNRAFEQAKQNRLLDHKTPYPLEEEQIVAQFSLEIEPNLTTLIADDLRLRQMLVHLLSNSLKFTEIGHPLGLKVSRWGGWIAFTVWDTGIGIPAEKQHLIFQKFQQLENPLTRQFEGAGLGLVLTRRLARLHGGDVTFTSKENQGSQFTILLPPAPPDQTQLIRGEKEDAAAEDLSIVFPSGRVPLYSQRDATETGIDTPPDPPRLRDRLMLIVDAVPHFVESLSEQLIGLGYRVVIARSGTEALEKARRLQPCIIFLNPLLPLLSGWDVLTLLKSNTETQTIPVVITATVIDEEQALRSRADSFLKLPIQPKELKQTLQQVLFDPKELDVLPQTANNLTILHLFTNQPHHPTEFSTDSYLSRFLQARQYRILESDDLEQAELLARVWKPNVVLLSGELRNPLDYLQQLSYRPMLASLPLITLDQKTTQAASQVSGLLVFPCLIGADSAAIADDSPEISTLLQVIQIAAGCVWRPSILAVDVSTLLLSTESRHGSESVDEALGHFPQETEWLQALLQYLQTAGLRGLMGRSWQEVMQQIESQSVDLLLLCWTATEPSSGMLAKLAELHTLANKPPIILLDHRNSELEITSLTPLPQEVQQLATQILTPPISMTELLDSIHQAIAQNSN